MSVTPSPIGGFAAQFFDNNGVILSGGKIYTYAAGTTTPQATYTSASGATPHANPIILDSAGRVPGGEIWLTDGLVYKFVIETATAILIGTYDNITGINSNFVNYTVQEEVITATAGQTVFNLSTINYTPATNSLTVYIDGVNQYVGDSYLETDSNTVTFTSGVHVGGEVKFTTAIQTTTGAVDASIVTYDPPFTGGVITNVEDKLAQYVSVKDFGAVGDGVTDDTAAIEAAILAADAIYFPEGTYVISDTLYMRGPFDGIYWRGKNFFGAGIEATRLKAAVGFSANYMIFMGNQDFNGVSNRVYSISNQISGMTLDNFNMGATTSQHGIFTFGTFNNRIQDVQIGVVAFPYDRWDMSVAQGTYTTIIDNVHCQQWQASTALVGDITTIFVNSGSATFVNLVGVTDIIFDKFTIQGTYSGGYQQNRVQISSCANVGFRNGDLEGDGVMFDIANSNGIMIDNNNVAMPGSYTKTAVNYASIFIRAQGCVGILAQGNVFMNWLNGPLTPAPGTYLSEPAAANRSMRLLDFNGASFAGARYTRTTAQVIPATTETVVNFATVDYDIGTFQLVNFASQTYTNTPYVTTGAGWSFAAPLRGYYSIKCNILLENLNTATEFAFIAVHVSGSEVARVYNSGATSSGLTALSIATDVFANATAPIQIKVYHTGAGAVELSAAATVNNLSIALLNVK